MKVFVDGKFVDEKKAVVSVFDHGLLYGDGVFEGIRAYNGRVFKLKEHVERLFFSAKAILLKIPMSQKAVASSRTRARPMQSFCMLRVPAGPVRTPSILSL